ncbi:hypothetical protein Mal48_05770 [Thalassoglobus polymorphus]|uniref:Uncharacterized protein n=1 Tax=Thalassoglobus polymorphus TaxID=2527994 RepID=A0A517QIB8_9PLAN|nr:hypothetical protein Mal48_05770 [Thalassoglobus polymorphus]
MIHRWKLGVIDSRALGNHNNSHTDKEGQISENSNPLALTGINAIVTESQ